MDKSFSLPLIPVILSGGVGVRLWPLSRPSTPKQFLKIFQGQSLFQQTLRRLPDFFQPPIIVGNRDHEWFVTQELASLSFEKGVFMGEPFGRNTTAAITVAALQSGPSAVLVIFPADHWVADPAPLERALLQACQVAQEGGLGTLGISPRSPEVGYGYIQQGLAHPQVAGVYTIKHFVEKPPLAQAEAMLQEGGYLWNSGIFVFHSGAFLQAMATLQPDILLACQEALSKAHHKTRGAFSCFLLDEDSFADSPSVAVDYGIMEKISHSFVVPVAEMGWNDVGSWQGLWQVSPQDKEGNVVSGEVITQDTHHCYIYGSSRLVTTLGVEGLTIVETPDAVYVGSQEKSQEIRQLVTQLEQQHKPQLQSHLREERPWGFYEILGQGPGYQVKCLTVSPGGKLSLQKHAHRQEVWVVVQGQGRAVCGEALHELTPGVSLTIPPETIHRLENTGSQVLKVIEVQGGSYLGEDDIVRLDDIYNRQ
jgi:mannose-1-phosphate guanylyltransferase/mannose-6-phosphate isomerase